MKKHSIIATLIIIATVVAVVAWQCILAWIVSFLFRIIVLACTGGLV